MEDITTGERLAVKLMERGLKVASFAHCPQGFVSCVKRLADHFTMPVPRTFCRVCTAAAAAAAANAPIAAACRRLQIDVNVEREVLNHKTLVHPNIVQFREVLQRSQARCSRTAARRLAELACVSFSKDTTSLYSAQLLQSAHSRLLVA